MMLEDDTLSLVILAQHGLPSQENYVVVINDVENIDFEGSCIDGILKASSQPNNLMRIKVSDMSARIGLPKEPRHTWINRVAL